MRFDYQTGLPLNQAVLNALDDLLPAIRARADRLDQSGVWPEEDLAALAEVGMLRGSIPAKCGGLERSSLDLHLIYEKLAAVSLAVSLIVSQRDAGVSVLTAAEPSALCDAMLQRLAVNDAFTTIGISQLTTSRQRGSPALTARRSAGGFRIDGEIPWATGAGQCDFICAGAQLEDGRQILFALPTNLSGVTVDPPLPLVALSASRTASVRCRAVQLPLDHVLVPPTGNALSARKPGVPIGQAFLALGLCRGAVDAFESIDSEPARIARERLSRQLEMLRNDVLSFVSAPAGDAVLGADLRSRCITLAQRCAHAAVSLFKGGGLLSGHPAQRLAREALFLLVWSCPAPVLECTVDLLSQDQP